MKRVSAYSFSLFMSMVMLGFSSFAYADDDDETIGDESPVAVGHSPGLSDEARQECLDSGMDDGEIDRDPGLCLNIFWTDERVVQASDNASSYSSSGDEIHQLLGDFPELVCDSDRDVPLLGDWALGIPSVGGLPPGLSEDYGSEMTGDLLSTRPTYDEECNVDGIHLFRCSASAVRTNSVDHVVATAAHCVHEGNGGQWHENVRFRPHLNQVDYLRGVLRGAFTVEQVGVSPEYIANKNAYSETAWGSVEHDVAFGVPGIDHSDFQGRKLSERVEGYNVSFDDMSEYSGVILGYPVVEECEGTETPQSHLCADIDVDSRPNLDINHVTKYLSGALKMGCENYVANISYKVGIAPFAKVFMYPTMYGCAMTGGASGGPWLSDYDAVSGEGTLRAVSSAIDTNEPMSVVGSPLGAKAESLYDCVVDSLVEVDECLVD